MSDPLLVERRGPAAWLTLNRPDKMNALNAELLAALEKALDEVAADDDVKVVVLTGAGERAFSAGFDLEAAAGDPPSATPPSSGTSTSSTTSP